MKYTEKKYRINNGIKKMFNSEIEEMICTFPEEKIKKIMGGDKRNKEEIILNTLTRGIKMPDKIKKGILKIIKKNITNGLFDYEEICSGITSVENILEEDKEYKKIIGTEKGIRYNKKIEKMLERFSSNKRLRYTMFNPIETDNYFENQITYILTLEVLENKKNCEKINFFTEDKKRERLAKKIRIKDDYNEFIIIKPKKEKIAEIKEKFIEEYNKWLEEEGFSKKEAKKEKTFKEIILMLKNAEKYGENCIITS